MLTWDQEVTPLLQEENHVAARHATRPATATPAASPVPAAAAKMAALATATHSLRLVSTTEKSSTEQKTGCHLSPKPLLPNHGNAFPWIGAGFELTKDRTFFKARVIKYQSRGTLAWD